MKRILYIFMAIAVLAGCKEPIQNEVQSAADIIAGEWHCSPSNIDADIYTYFSKEGTFELYQQIGEGAFRLYRGTWALDEVTMKISGKYNDGESWGSDYTVTLSDDGNSMTFVDSASNEYVYSRQAIPASVKDNCVVEVKSPYAY